METVFKDFRNRFLVFVGCLGSCFSDFLGLENKFENEAIFSKKQISRSGSGYADPWLFGPSKDRKAKPDSFKSNDC